MWRRTHGLLPPPPAGEGCGWGSEDPRSVCHSTNLERVPIRLERNALAIKVDANDPYPRYTFCWPMGWLSYRRYSVATSGNLLRPGGC